MTAEIARGTVEGTGSAINVSLGFIPDYVKVMNIDGTNAVSIEWTADMPDDAGQKLIGGTVAFSTLSTGGVTAYDGDENNAPGFTIGTDADLNASAETIVYVAMRSGLGIQDKHYVA